MRRPELTVIASVLVALALPAAAAGQGGEMLDATCPGPPGGTNFNNPPASTQNRFAQVFTVGVTGALTRAEAAIRKSGTAGDYRIDIAELNHSGIPSNNVIASAVVPDAAVPAGDFLLSVAFAPAAAITAGQRYALVVTRPGSETLGVGTHTGDLCPGALFESTSQTGPYLLTEPDLDLVYSIFVTPSNGGSPETSITRGPKDRTRRRTATFEFSGTDARAVASFECSLDGSAFSACASPFTVRVRRGRHSFAVRAVDGAGNADGSPASDVWKVKKKKRR